MMGVHFLLEIQENQEFRFALFWRRGDIFLKNIV